MMLSLSCPSSSYLLELKYLWVSAYINLLSCFEQMKKAKACIEQSTSELRVLRQQKTLLVEENAALKNKVNDLVNNYAKTVETVIIEETTVPKVLQVF